MKTTSLLSALVISGGLYAATPLRFSFNPESVIPSFQTVSADTRFQEKGDYGYDLTAAHAGENKPFFFSVHVHDGNYRIVVTLGSDTDEGSTTVRGESRRLFFENVKTAKGESRQVAFTINKRNTVINDTERVRIKPREQKKLNWDDKLTLEFNGKAPRVRSVEIIPVADVPTVFLCGNSTVVDQDNEPWASWGQMIPRFFNDRVCFANYAESGESANTFIRAKRLKKLLTQVKAGDFVFVEFGHNDQKQKGPGKGAYTSFTDSLRVFVNESRSRGASIVFVTPTQRRSFDDNGKIRDTHEDYPDAMRALAQKEGVPVIELHQMTRVLYEALGVEKSMKAFVHYPANTYPGQDKPLADNTHFNPYGAYQIAQCVIEGMKNNNLPLTQYLRPDYKGYDPAKPQSPDTFEWDLSPFAEVEKPDGN